MFKAVCKLGLEGIVSKKMDAPYRSGPSRIWNKVKNPKAPAATRQSTGRFNKVGAETWPRASDARSRRGCNGKRGRSAKKL
jgi:hypothetical protein